MSERRINLSDMDFGSIKSSLIAYMKSQDSAVSDYNYEGSAVNTIMDMLAYITHANAVNANMALNEAFLDTAQLRESVVSHAKLLGYTPRSTKGATATVNITINGEYDNTGAASWNAIGGVAQDLTLKYGTPITTTFNGQTHNLMIADDYVESASGNTWIFTDVKVVQGERRTRKYRYDETNQERYICYDAFVDTEYLTVTVGDGTSTGSTNFFKSDQIVNKSTTDPIFFLEEARDGFYEVIFGDGKIGQRLSAGNIITLDYITVGGANINGAQTFTLPSVGASTPDAASNTAIVVTATAPCSGGMPRESVASVKYSAPRSHTAQNRAVTTDDYKAILQRDFSGIKTVSVWGGEDNVPPEYGKVFLALKPGEAYGSEVYSDLDKEKIITQILKPKNIVAIQPVLLDPNYIDINLDISFKYDPNITSATAVAIAAKIRSRLSAYNDDTLHLFGGIFRHSNILGLIDSSDVSIVSSVASVTMQKSTVVVLGDPQNFKVEFNQALADIEPGSRITSNAFVYRGNVCKLKDYFNTDEGQQIIQVVNLADAVINPNVGYIDLGIGCVYLNDFAPESLVGDSGNEIIIKTKSASPDVKPLRADLLRINLDNATIQADIDTVVVGGSSAAIAYTTTQVVGGY
jgi:hypothetical protein